jgi:hypothetical protein
MDKYDQAIEFLKSVEPGSYFDECAELMEELLAQVHKSRPKPQQWTAEELAWAKQAEGGARFYMKSRGRI